MKTPKCIDYGPVSDPKDMNGYTNVRWVENVSRGLRFIGYADEVARKEGRWRAIDHHGWFTADDGDSGELLRGAVYKLPSRHGLPQYVYGYADPVNDDCARICFEPELDPMRAAMKADHFAEAVAEEERSYRRAWDAGQRHEQINEAIKELRTEVLRIGREMRAVKPSPSICSVLRDRIITDYVEIKKLRREREELRETYGDEEAFKESIHEGL